jgi:uncharacterized protein
MSTIPLILSVSAVLFLGGFVQGFSGFGLALCSVPLLSLFLDIRLVVPLVAIFGWLVTIPITAGLRSHLCWSTGILLAIGAIPGSFLGARMLTLLPVPLLLFIMGCTLVAGGLMALVGRRVIIPQMPPPATLASGFFAGCLGAAVGEPGPPAVAFMNMQPWSPERIKATLNLFFLLQMSLTLTFFWIDGLYTPEVIGIFLKALPVAAIGIGLGMFAFHHARARNVDLHRIMHMVILALGIALLVKAAHQMFQH